MTPAEYLQLEAAQRAKLRRKGFEDPVEGTDDESELHSAIISECNRRGWIAFHGSMAHRTFKTKGEPDFVILAPEIPALASYREVPPRCILIECKTRTGKLSPDQQAIHAWAEKLGHKIHTVRSFQDFLNVINP